MEPMDQLLRDLPDHPPRPELPQRVRMDFKRRALKARRVRRVLSLALIIGGLGWMLPALPQVYGAVQLPQNGLGMARTSAQLLANPQGTLQSLPAALDGLQWGLFSRLPLTLWLGAALVALGALLALACWMPAHHRRVNG